MSGSSWSGYYTIDPNEMETRFCNEDGLAFLDTTFDEPTEEDMEKIGRIQHILPLLPPREADFIELYYFKKLRQTDIAEIFGVSQPTVCYRLTRAASRIRFLLDLPVVNVDKMVSDLSGFLSDPLDVRILLLMWETTCQSEVAKRLGVSQGLVRHRFLRAVNRMSANRHFQSYADLFKFIASHLNILREVQRPTWDERVAFCIS